MNTTANVLVGLVAALHIYILVLEMFLWERKPGRELSGFDAEMARATAPLAANQGLYNGFLAAGLIWGLIAADPTGYRVQVFFLSCVSSRASTAASPRTGASWWRRRCRARSRWRPCWWRDERPRGTRAPNAPGPGCARLCSPSAPSARSKRSASRRWYAGRGWAGPRSICTTRTSRHWRSTPARRSYGTRWTPSTPGAAPRTRPLRRPR